MGSRILLALSGLILLSACGKLDASKINLNGTPFVDPNKATFSSSDIAVTTPGQCDGTTATKFTVPLVNASGSPLVGITPTVTSSQATDSITCTASNASGISTCTVYCTVAGTRSFTVSAGGNSATVAVAITAPQPPLTMGIVAGGPCNDPNVNPLNVSATNVTGCGAAINNGKTDGTGACASAGATSAATCTGGVQAGCVTACNTLTGAGAKVRVNPSLGAISSAYFAGPEAGSTTTYNSADAGPYAPSSGTTKACYQATDLAAPAVPVGAYTNCSPTASTANYVMRTGIRGMILDLTNNID